MLLKDLNLVVPVLCILCQILEPNHAQIAGLVIQHMPLDFATSPKLHQCNDSVYHGFVETDLELDHLVDLNLDHLIDLDFINLLKNSDDCIGFKSFDLLVWNPDMECDNSTKLTQSSMTLALQCIQYSSIFLHSLSVNYAQCPLSSETCKTLDSLNLLRKPCLSHCQVFDKANMKNDARAPKHRRWRRRGKRGGVKARNRPTVPLPHSNPLPSSYTNGRYLTIRLWNATSLRNRTTTVSDYLLEDDIINKYNKHE